MKTHDMIVMCWKCLLQWIIVKSNAGMLYSLSMSCYLFNYVIDEWYIVVLCVKVCVKWLEMFDRCHFVNIEPTAFLSIASTLLECFRSLKPSSNIIVHDENH